MIKESVYMDVAEEFGTSVGVAHVIGYKNKKEQIKAEGKPAEMAEKIAVGKVNKFLKDNTLIHQPFVKDASKTVADYLKSIDVDLKVTSFVRVALG